METGTVKSFGLNDRGGFGFLTLASGATLYFQRNDGGSVELGSHGPQINRQQLVREPKVGDLINFAWGKNRQGPKAAPWCFHEEWNLALIEQQCRVDGRLAEATRHRVETQFASIATLVESGKLSQAYESACLLELPQRGDLPEAVEQLLDDLVRPASTDFYGQCYARKEVLVSEVKARVKVIATSRRMQVKANDLMSRLESCLSLGNLGGAEAAHAELSTFENKQALAIRMGSADVAHSFLQMKASIIRQKRSAKPPKKRKLVLAR